MKLSIIIPMFNVEKYINQCLNSLIHQDISSSNYEIVIINDGSTDSSYLKASVFQEKYPHVKIYTQQNSGVSSARNKGIEISSGEYFFFIDADDYIALNSLKGIVNLANDKQLDMQEFKAFRTR